MAEGFVEGGVGVHRLAIGEFVRGLTRVAPEGQGQARGFDRLGDRGGLIGAGAVGIRGMSRERTARAARPPDPLAPSAVSTLVQ